MSFFLSNLTNDSRLWKVSHNSTDLMNSPETLTLSLFCLICLMTLVALVGSIFSLVSLLTMQYRTVVSMLVTSWSVDDLLSVLSVAIFMVLQWPREAPGYFQSLCTTSALLYMCQGLSSNLKATLIVFYNFYTMHRTVVSQSSSWRSGQVLGVALTVWAVSLLLASLPLCGWGVFVRTPWGCLTDCSSPYVLLLFAVYASAFGLLAVLSVPLTHQLLCSEEPPRLHANYQEISRGASTPGTPAAGGRVLCLLPEDVEIPALPGTGSSLSSDMVFAPGQPAASSAGAGKRENLWTPRGSSSFPVSLAQKRFALILALTKVILWLPMMIHMVVKHVVGFQSLPVDMLSFLLTLLASTVTPVFVLSKRWAHLPCGCIINCQPDTYSVAFDGKKSKRKGFEFNLSFQQSYGLYKMTHADYYDDDDENPISYHNPKKYECEATKEPREDNHGVFNTITVEISTTPPLDSATLTGVNKCTNTDIPEPKQAVSEEKGAFSIKTECAINYGEATSFEGPERRLSHEETQKPDLSDWEWCRSKSERTPRQRSGGGLAIPICAFQGTVSLQAPTGKTLSLSTYETPT
ncbi:probable G-protein coupled receptor 149 isoform X1 [Rattus norvegicus]|uniref:probable G-protein coupled receptor 149 isoform 2 n=1 Tax=Rattus norvegicus TaxID=10116 RepID=UPI0019177221|nr:probable G-protein coupled receptor 149 isoform X1 [Rattus norvegicus]